MAEKLDGNYTRMQQATLKMTWWQHPAKLLPPISKTIKVRRTRHAGDCWRSKDELISNILSWTSSHGRAKVEQPAKTYIQQLSGNTGCSLVNISGAMDEEMGGERVLGRSVQAAWHDYDDNIYIYIYI